ncbi:MAG: hypothetical protein HQ592_12130 [Planctomycetes bacterium]|nr:hypothetical protein [Planctomycetota bacterium]
MASPLAAEWGPPPTLGVPRDGLEVERRDIPPLDINRDPADNNRLLAEQFPKWEKNWWREHTGIASKSPQERDATLRERKDPLKHFLEDYPYGLKLPDDLKLKDVPPAFGDLTPERNGRMDIFYARGALDHKLRLYEAFAHLPRARISEARFSCSFGPNGYRLSDNVTPQTMPGHDVLVYVDIPHPAIGVNQCYAMLDYVKGGGAILFFGGEYAFGKGRYAYTVLDRELLPVDSASLDNRYAPEPLPLEPGPDFHELGVDIDFADRPVFWAWNQVALREGADVKVLLKSGNRPILVGRQLGQGRVACFMAMHRGVSGDGTTAFFEWAEWPRLTAAVLRWLAPAAAAVRPRGALVTPDEIASLRDQLEGDLMEDLLDEAMAAEPDLLGGADVGPGGASGGADVAELAGPALKERARVLRRVLRGDGPEISTLLARQLAAVANLPPRLRFDMLEFIRRNPSPAAAEAARKCLRARDPAVKASGYQLLALAGDGSLRRHLESPAPALELRPADRFRALALAVALYEKDDLVDLGRTRIASWNAAEASARDTYTDGKGFSMAAPEIPCLDSEGLFARVAWLGYMVQSEPEAYARQFAREWAMLAQYRDLCDRTSVNLWFGISQSPSTPAERQRVKQRTEELAAFRDLLAWLERITEPQLAAILRSHPQQTAEGFARARFLQEAKQVINALAAIPPQETRTHLEILQQARLPLLRAFATARLAAQ